MNEEEEGKKEKIKKRINILSAEKAEGVREILERIHEMKVKGMTEKDAPLLNEVLKWDICL